jgi:hypothetical protein
MLCDVGLLRCARVGSGLGARVCGRARDYPRATGEELGVRRMGMGPVLPTRVEGVTSIAVRAN